MIPVRKGRRAKRWLAIVTPLVLAMALVPSPSALAAVGDITEVPIQGTIPVSGACEVHYDQYGKLWTEEYLSSQFGRYDPATGTWEQFNTPMPLSVPGTGVLGPDGYIWAPEVTGNSLLHINTSTGAMGEIRFPWANALDTRVAGIPLHTGLGLSNDIVEGSDGNMWFTLGGLNSIGSYDIATGQFQKYQVPGEFTGVTSALFGILKPGPGHSVVFTIPVQNEVGMFNFDTHQFTMFTLPTLLSFPVGINYDRNTGHIWAAEALGMKLADIDPATGHIKEISLLTIPNILKLLLLGGSIGNPLPSPGPIIQADDGNMYFLISFPAAGSSGNGFARINPTTDAVDVWTTPSSLSYPCALSQEHHGEIWFGELEANKIAKFQYA